jgi:excisionase family DNA binding protein
VLGLADSGRPSQAYARILVSAPIFDDLQFSFLGSFSLHQGDLASQPPTLAYSVPEATAALGLGRNTIYDLISSGRLHSIKVGSRRIIRAFALREFLGGAAA